MNIKTNNRYYLFFVVFLLIVTNLVSKLVPAMGRFSMDEVIIYLIIAAVGFALLRKSGTPIMEALPYNKGLKLPTIGLIILLVIVQIPLANMLGMVGGVIFGDVLDYASSHGVLMGSTSFIENFFATAILPAIFEEMFFRGFFYHGFKKARGARFAIIMTGLLFGIFHFNFQQIFYACLIGIVIAVIRELTGSMWAGMLFHMVNNGTSVVMSQLAKMGHTWVNHIPVIDLSFSTGGGIAKAVIIGVVCAILTVLVVCLIARTEGKTTELRSFFGGSREGDVTERPEADGDLAVSKQRVITAPLIIAILLDLAMATSIVIMLHKG